MKSYQEILKTFTKANKTYKLNLATRAGFNTIEGYREFLIKAISAAPTTPALTSKKPNQKKQPTATTVPQVKPTIHIVEILDRSGSMSGGKLTNAVTGINTEIAELKKATDVNYTMSIIKFDDSIQRVCMLTPIEKVNKITIHLGGSTALYQAIGETLETLFQVEVPGDKYLIKIFTDGEENASRGKYKTTKATADIIKKAEEKGFTVTFVGTASDVAYIQRALSIDDSNTLVHDNTAKGVADSFEASRGATVLYASKVLRGEKVVKGFYKKVGKL